MARARYCRIFWESSPCDFLCSKKADMSHRLFAKSVAGILGQQQGKQGIKRPVYRPLNASNGPPAAAPPAERSPAADSPKSTSSKPSPSTGAKLKDGLIRLPNGYNLNVRRDSQEASPQEGRNCTSPEVETPSQISREAELVSRFPGCNFDTLLTAELQSVYLTPLEPKLAAVTTQEAAKLEDQQKVATHFIDGVSIACRALHFLHSLLDLVSRSAALINAGPRDCKRSLAGVARHLSHIYATRWVLGSLALAVGPDRLPAIQKAADDQEIAPAFSYHSCSLSSPAFDFLLSEEWLWQSIFFDPEDGQSLSQLANLHSKISLINPTSRFQKIVAKSRNGQAVDSSYKLVSEKLSHLFQKLAAVSSTSFSCGDVWELGPAMSASAPLTYLSFINTPELQSLDRLQLISEFPMLSPWKIIAEPFLSEPITSPLFITWCLMRGCLCQRRATDQDQVSLFLRDFVSRSRWIKNDHWAPSDSLNDTTVIRSKSPALFSLVTNALRLIGLIQSRIDLDDFSVIASESFKFLKSAICGELNESQDLPWMNIVMSSIACLYTLEKNRTEYDSLWASQTQMCCLYLMLRYLSIFIQSVKSSGSPLLSAIACCLKWMEKEKFFDQHFWDALRTEKSLVVFSNQFLECPKFNQIEKNNLYCEFQALSSSIVDLLSSVKLAYSVGSDQVHVSLPEDRFWLLERSYLTCDGDETESPSQPNAEHHTTEGVSNYPGLERFCTVRFWSCPKSLATIVATRLSRIREISEGFPRIERETPTRTPTVKIPKSTPGTSPSAAVPLSFIDGKKQNPGH
eukprot:Gregarina_sp_Poly_1__10868@NODE_845_length_6002_cov_108_680371_g610_i0_p1_GENE_NODE_845_length_6002_cov_108_680371_g610_i0NODE_845_length_6002_cov_108_680371_g610_i0_p1_ORF_typecomplete_len799_score121_10EST1_DNA_bind/PF10373_9/4_2e07_NODE_845_length_6002_cov_108_680371_g610_i06553051